MNNSETILPISPQPSISGCLKTKILCFGFMGQNLRGLR